MPYMPYRSSLPLLACVLAAFVAVSNLLSPALAAPPQNITQRISQNITMDFQEADIRAVIKFMSELTGTNYLIDNRVQGKVTIITPTKVTVPEAQRIFESILQVQGYAVVPSGQVTKIVPTTEARQNGVQVQGSGEPSPPGDILVSQLIRLRYVDAAQLVPILRPLISANSYLAAHESSNTLILTDYAANVRQITEIIRRLDVAERAESARLFTLRYASATKIADIMSRLFPGGEKQGPSARFLPDDRTNSLVVLSDGRSFARIESVIRSLDRPQGRGANHIHVYYLKNAYAEEMAKVLSEMIKRMEGTGKDEVRLQGFTRPVSIMPDKATNSLVIGAEAQDYETLRAVIEKLDIRRLQVYVEALILEITADRSKEFGIEWRGTQDFTRPDAGRSLFGGTSFNGQDPASGSLINLIQNPLNVGNGLSIGVVDGIVNFGGATFANIGALLRALSQDSDVNVLSTPNLLTLDNEEAEIVVGQNVPFLTGTAPTRDSLATPFQTITREDIGIKLRLKPQISEGDSVRLSIYQEISSVVPNTINSAQGIITNKRSIKTTVSVREGQMIALGGLIQDDNTVSTSKVPVLGDLPLLGALFRSTKNAKTKTDLMVFLLPHVIRNPRDLESLSREKYDVIGGEMDTRRAGEPPQRGLLHPPNLPPGGSSGIAPDRPAARAAPPPAPAPASRMREPKAPERESPWSREDSF